MYLLQDGLPVDKSPLFQGYAMTRSEFTNCDNRMRYNMMIDSSYYWDNENPGSRINWLSDAADIANSRGRHNAATGTGYQTQKWVAERRLQDNEEGYDWPVIRLAEVYLNLRKLNSKKMVRSVMPTLTNRSTWFVTGSTKQCQN